MKLGDQRFLYDPDKTRAGYATMQQGGADDCACLFCKNFAAQRDSVYPTSLLSVFAKLGIDSRLEAESYECGIDESGLRFYGGWLFFVGELLDKGERQVSDSTFEYWVSDVGKPSPTGTFDGPLMTVEFTTRLPWVLAEEI